jgi:hypothetical protein
MTNTGTRDARIGVARWRRAAGVAVAAVALAAAAACGEPGARGGAGLPLDGEQHYAVFLTNGQVFFGRPLASGEWDPARGSVLRMRDVYYVQAQVDAETREQRNILVRRGNEWHGPTEMAVHPNHVISIEPVGDGSAVSGLIRQLREQNP